MLTIVLVAALVAGARARFTTLPGFRSPQMGYNSWYDVLMNPSAESVLATASAMAKSGLQSAGYVYVNLDDGIVQVDRDASGNLVPTPAMGDWKTLSDSLHASGFKFGVYTDRGPKCVRPSACAPSTTAGECTLTHNTFATPPPHATRTCGGRASAQGFEAKDAAFYAANGVD